jgi:hypothetical protein
MPHPNASKGARWESWCASYLGLKRITRKGDHDDVGDLGPDDLFVYECKNDASRSPMQWWKQAFRARILAQKPFALVLSKARMPRPGEPRGWAQMSIEQWGDLRVYIKQLESVAEHYRCLDALRGGLHTASAVRMEDVEMSLSPRQAPERESESAA